MEIYELLGAGGEAHDSVSCLQEQIIRSCQTMPIAELLKEMFLVTVRGRIC